MTTSLGRKTFVLATLIPLVAVGLTGCQGGDDPQPRKPKSTKTAQATNNQGGGLPFGGNQPTETSAPEPQPTETQAAPQPTTNAPAPSTQAAPSGGGGSDTISWDGGKDLNSLDWDVTCYGLSQYSDTMNVSAIESGRKHSDATAHTFSISANKDGVVDFLHIVIPEDKDTSLWYSSLGTAPATPAPTMKLEGGVVTVSGQAYLYADYNEKTPITFEVKASCDTEY